MDYGQTIRQAWETTWRHRFLWLLGLLAGSSAGLSFQGQPTRWSAGPQEWRGPGPALEREAAAVAGWLMANMAIVVAVGVGVVLLGLALLVVSLVAQGGMARATADLAEGRTSSLGLAWRAGLRLVWRYAGLWALLALAAAAAALLVAASGTTIGWALYAGTRVSTLAALAAALALGVLVALAALLLALVGDLLGVRRYRVLWMTVAVVTVVPVVLAAVFFAAAVSVVVLYAQRAIAVEDVGPVAALRSGWRLLRAHLGESALAWLVALGLAMAGGAVVAAVAAAVAAVLGAVGFAVWSATGLTAATVVYAALAATAALGVVLTLVGAVNAFFWNYWTIAYLRLSRPGTTG